MGCTGHASDAPATEDHYSLSLTTYDLTNGIPYELTQAVHYTTAGPVVCVGDTSNKFPQWGLTVLTGLRLATKERRLQPRPLWEQFGRLIRPPPWFPVIHHSQSATSSPGQERLSNHDGIHSLGGVSGTRDIPFELLLLQQGNSILARYLTIRVVNPVGIVQEQKLMPKMYELSQNYPNPFNPSTTIRYGLPERSHVSLAVYNTLGQQVTVLQNGEQEAGYHEVKFDASNLPSGVYFYRLQAGSYVETRKLCLVR